MQQENLLELFLETRAETEKICSFLETEDYVAQPILDVSPPKWHLAHTSWFFEEFLLKKEKFYSLFSKDFSFLFNSYYESIGEKVQRDERGSLTRPTVAEVYKYRLHVTEGMANLLDRGISEEQKKRTLIGIHHEKQHQELLLTDIKYILGTHPLFPKYNDLFEENPMETSEQEWIEIPEGIYEIGHDPTGGFCYDNEQDRHKVYLGKFSISNRLVTNAEFLEFMKDGGYDQVLLWHMEGWQWKNSNKINSPFYWHFLNDDWYQYTLQGLKKVNMEAPLSHISFYEAAAFAKWKKMRLPTEFEWEAASEKLNYGKRWEWTGSAYLPYPGYLQEEGAIGEYNGKFMVNQMVLRGGSVASPQKHLRKTYRNFFHPPLRWQYTGIRLAH